MPSQVQFWRCEACYDVFETEELLRAPNPFDPSDEIVGCPHCKTAEDFINVCDWPGCCKPVSSGTAMPNGDYVNRCLDHGPHHLARRGMAPYPNAQGIETRSDETRDAAQPEG